MAHATTMAWANFEFCNFLLSYFSSVYCLFIMYCFALLFLDCLSHTFMWVVVINEKLSFAVNIVVWTPTPIPYLFLRYFHQNPQIWFMIIGISPTQMSYIMQVSFPCLTVALHWLSWFCLCYMIKWFYMMKWVFLYKKCIWSQLNLF